MYFGVNWKIYWLKFIDGVQPGQGGLQLMASDGQWKEVIVPPGALLVNLGSLMTHWTNGRWKSTLHRVTNPHPDLALHSRRMSCAFFHKVSFDCIVEVLPTCCSSEHPPLYPPTLAANLTRAGILHKYRHMTPREASEAYHRELAQIRGSGTY